MAAIALVKAIIRAQAVIGRGKHGKGDDREMQSNVHVAAAAGSNNGGAA